jgi:hypothetical protein
MEGNWQLMPGYSPYHSLYLAHRITLEGVSDDAFAKSLSAARVEMNPHQVDAALFALQSPILRGAILADEVGLGKTIEASLVIAQRWAERKRRILLIVPASLRKQWMQELHDKFGLSSVILEAKSYRERIKKGEVRPFEVENAIVVTSYEFGAMKADDLAKTNWDLVVFDEAHRLRNVYRKGASTTAAGQYANRASELVTDKEWHKSLSVRQRAASSLDCRSANQCSITFDRRTARYVLWARSSNGFLSPGPPDAMPNQFGSAMKPRTSDNRRIAISATRHIPNAATICNSGTAAIRNWSIATTE